MRPGTRVAVGLALVVVLGVAAGVTYLLTSLDVIVARQIERYGTALADAAVDVDGVEIDLATGTGTIHGLRIANPEGFSNETAIALDDITLQIDAASLREPPLRLQRIEVGRTDVRFEVDASGETNIGVLRRNAQGPAPVEVAEPGDPRRLRIDRLAFAGGQIATHVEGTDRADRTVALPRLVLTNLGGRQGGTPAEIGRQAMLDLTRGVAVAVAGSELRDVVKRGVGSLIDRILQ